MLLHELRVTPETDALFIALNFRSGAPGEKSSLDLIMDFVLILGKVEISVGIGLSRTLVQINRIVSMCRFRKVLHLYLSPL